MASTPIIKAKTSLTTAAKLRQDTQMIMQPYTNWEQHLTPVPLSISVLGELIFISSKDDFSIDRNPPENGFQFIKYPNSFRACLMQVCNAGWSAFNEAHTSMDQIRLHTGNVPQHVRTAVEVILQDDDILFQAILPDTLETIDSIASECLQLSIMTKDKFTEVISLVHEILLASTSAKKAYNEDLKKITQTIEQNEIRKAAAMKADERAKKDLENLKTKLDEAEKQFDKAMNSMPSGWDMISMNLAEGLSQSLNNLMSGLTNVMIFNFDKRQGKAAPHNEKSAQGTGTEETEQIGKYFAVKDVYDNAIMIMNMMESLKSYQTKENKINWSDLYDQISQKTKSDCQKDFLVDIKNTITALKDSDTKTTALGICDEGISICTKLANIAPTMGRDCDDSQEQKLVQEIANLHERAQTFHATAKRVTNASPFIQKPPGLSQAQSASQFAAENARIQIEEARNALNNARQIYNEARERVEKKDEELINILITLQTCDVKKIDFKTTLEILSMGLAALGNVKEQWEKMVLFFQTVTAIIKTSMVTASKTFTNRAKQASKYSRNTFLKDMVYNQAFQVSNIASLVNMISGTYTEVSEKYVMDRISSLGRLMALDPSSNEFNLERLQLQEACLTAKNGIVALVQKNKTDFNQKIEERLTELEGLYALLPPPTKEEEEKVKRITSTPSENISINQFD